jgi:hypothetical protein
MQVQRAPRPPIDAVSIPVLVSELAKTLGQLLRRHIELARAETFAQIKRELAVVSGFVAAGLFGLVALLGLAAAAIAALALALPVWASALIVAGAAAGAAGIFGLVGSRRRVRRPLDHTRQMLSEDARWLKPTH